MFSCVSEPVCTIGGGGWAGREDNNVHVNAFGDHAQNTGIYSYFSSLYNILCKHVEQDTLSQASMPLATMPNTPIFAAFCFFVQHTAQVCGARQVVTSIYAFGDHAQNTGIHSVFASLYSILCKCCIPFVKKMRKTPATKEAYQTFKNYFVIFDTHSCLMRVFVGPVSTFGTS